MPSKACHGSWPARGGEPSCLGDVDIDGGADVDGDGAWSDGSDWSAQKKKKKRGGGFDGHEATEQRATDVARRDDEERKKRPSASRVAGHEYSATGVGPTLQLKRAEWRLLLYLADVDGCKSSWLLQVLLLSRLWILIKDLSL